MRGYIDRGKAVELPLDYVKPAPVRTHGETVRFAGHRDFVDDCTGRQIHKLELVLPGRGKPDLPALVGHDELHHPHAAGQSTENAPCSDVNDRYRARTCIPDEERSTVSAENSGHCILAG